MPLLPASREASLWARGHKAGMLSDVTRAPRCAPVKAALRPGIKKLPADLTFSGTPPQLAITCDMRPIESSLSNCCKRHELTPWQPLGLLFAKVSVSLSRAEPRFDGRVGMLPEGCKRVGPA